jgi:hypothetical protein
MVPISIPEDGDVVVTDERQPAALRYALFVKPGQHQFACAGRADATAKALAFAERVGVDAWYADDNGFRRLGHFRSGAVLSRRS